MPSVTKSDGRYLSVGKIFQLSEAQTAKNRAWNKGYHDGYNGLPIDTGQHELLKATYGAAYLVGDQDRTEDQQKIALAGFDFDDLTPEERELIYDKIDRI